MNFTYAFIGGVLIGLSAVVLLLFNGRIAGISGMLKNSISSKSEFFWSWLFIAGMILGGLAYEYLFASKPTPTYTLAPFTMIVGGLIAGFGARMGGGCTSGHGVCGLGRLSKRSFVAVLTFMATAIVTVWVVRHSGWL